MWEASGRRAGRRASERATRRPGDRAGRHAGGSTVPWGWCGRACTGLARAHQRAHGGIPPAFQRRQISRSLGSTCPSHPPFCATHHPCNSRTHHTGPFKPVQDRPQVLWRPSPGPRAARAWLGRSSLSSFACCFSFFSPHFVPTTGCYYVTCLAIANQPRKLGVNAPGPYPTWSHRRACRPDG